MPSDYPKSGITPCAARPDTAWVKNRAWYVYPVLALVATTLYYAMGQNSVLFNLIGLTSPILILVAVRIHKPEKRWPWYLIAIGQLIFIAGDVVSYNYEGFHELLPSIFRLDYTYNPAGDVPFPGIADMLYLAVYPCLIAGMVLMVRARTPGRDRSSLLDSLMLAVGVGTVSWVLLISPYIHLADLDLKTKLTAMAYPMMDLLLAAVSIRLAVGAGRKPVAFFLMIAAIAALFVTDAIYAWFGLYTASGYQPGAGYLEFGWMAFYVLLGTAALHPSMRQLTEQTPELDDRLTFGRLALLTSAALAPPVLRLVQNFRGEPVDTGVLSIASIVLFLLVVARMSGLIRQQERSTKRERALRESGSALVTATNRDGIHSAAIDAAQSLAGTDAAIRMCEERDEASGLEVVAAAGGRADVVGTRFSLEDLQEWKRERLLENDAYLVASYESTLRDTLALPVEDDGSVFVAPLFIRDELHGLMVVSTNEEMARTTADSLRALSSQVALALESAALTEDLLRQESEARFASLVQNSSDIVTVVELDTTVHYASPSAHRVLGFPPEQLEGTKFADLIHPDDMTRVLSFLSSVGEGEGHTGIVEFRMRCKDGTFVVVETLRTNLLARPERPRHRPQHPRHLRAQGVRGAALAPGVPRLGDEPREPGAVPGPRRRTRSSASAATASPSPSCSWTSTTSRRSTTRSGTRAGDQLLREVGDRIKECLRPADTAARLGGDEFAILLEDAGDGIQAVDVADRMMEALEAPFALEGKEVFVRASASASPSPSGDEIRRRPRSCSATPTSRCTWPRSAARAATRSSSPRCTTRALKRAGAEGRPAARARRTRSSSSTTSP